MKQPLSIAQSSRNTIARLAEEISVKTKDLSKVTADVEAKQSLLSGVAKQIEEARTILASVLSDIDEGRKEYVRINERNDEAKTLGENLATKITKNEGIILEQDFIITQNVETIEKSEKRLEELNASIEVGKVDLKMARDAVRLEEDNLAGWVGKREKVIKDVQDAETRRDTALAMEHEANENIKRLQRKSPLKTVNIIRPQQ